MRTKLKCVHHGCVTNSLPIGEQGPFFCFPRVENLRREWILNLGRHDLLTLTYEQILDRGFRVCRLHFTDNQFQTVEKKKLNAGQIPVSVYSSELTHVEKNDAILNDSGQTQVEDECPSRKRLRVENFSNADPRTSDSSKYLYTSD